MLRLSLTVLAGLTLVAAPAYAADQEQAPPSVDAAAKPEPKICKKELATGSRARVTKICLTRTEWRELNAKTRDQVDSYSNRQAQTNGGAGQAG